MNFWVSSTCNKRRFWSSYSWPRLPGSSSILNLQIFPLRPPISASLSVLFASSSVRRLQYSFMSLAVEWPIVRSFVSFCHLTIPLSLQILSSCPSNERDSPSLCMPIFFLSARPPSLLSLSLHLTLCLGSSASASLPINAEDRWCWMLCNVYLTEVFNQRSLLGLGSSLKKSVVQDVNLQNQVIFYSNTVLYIQATVYHRRLSLFKNNLHPQM